MTSELVLVPARQRRRRGYDLLEESDSDSNEQDSGLSREDRPDTQAHHQLLFDSEEERGDEGQDGQEFASGSDPATAVFGTSPAVAATGRKALTSSRSTDRPYLAAYRPVSRAQLSSSVQREIIELPDSAALPVHGRRPRDDDDANSRKSNSDDDNRNNHNDDDDDDDDDAYLLDMGLHHDDDDGGSQGHGQQQRHAGMMRSPLQPLIFRSEFGGSRDSFSGLTDDLLSLEQQQLLPGAQASSSSPGSATVGLTQGRSYSNMAAEMETTARSMVGSKPQPRQFVFSDDPDADYLPPPPTASTWLLLLCFPCANFVMRNALTSSATVAELKSAVMSFISVVSLAQFIILVVSLTDGLASVAENPMIGPGEATLISLGAQNANLIKGSAQLWRMFTSLFLHAGIVHWLFNLLMQIRIGLFLERRWRWIRLSIIFFISGVAGNLLACVLQPLSTGASASAAFVGVVGANTVEVLFTWYKTQSHVRVTALALCVFYIIATFIIGSVDRYIENSATFGGIIVGVLLGIYYSVTDSQLDVTVKDFLPKVILVVVTLFFVANFVIFFSLINTTTLTSVLSSGPQNTTAGIV